MPKYRVTYLDAHGRAETARQMLEVAGVEWEDVRLTPQQWQDFKPKTPFGQLPILEELESGFQLCQTNAINRYLAAKFGLAGKTAEDAAKVDMMLESFTDFLSPMVLIFLEKDESRKTSLCEKFRDKDIPAFMNNLEALLVKNKGGNGFLVGDEMTVADISFTELITWPAKLGYPASFDKTPKLKALTERIKSQPAIAAWLKKRPVPSF